MAKLPKSIIKKYGISKKAWSVFRGQSRTSSSSRGTMAKKTRSKKKYSSNSNLLMVVGASMLYGAGRAKLSQLTQQYIPSFAGQYTDEVVLGLLGWYLSKKGGMIGAVGKSALIIESASVGNQLIAPMLNNAISVNN